MTRPNPDRRRALQAGFATLGASLLTSGKTLADAKPAPKGGLAEIAKPAASSCGCDRAADGSPLDTAFSELRPMLERYQADLRDMNRIYPLASSPTRKAKAGRLFLWPVAVAGKRALRILDSRRPHRLHPFSQSPPASARTAEG